MYIVPKIFLILLAVIVLLTAGTIYAGENEDEGTEIDRISIDEGSVHTVEHVYKPVYSALWRIVLVLSIIEMLVGVVWILPTENL